MPEIIDLSQEIFPGMPVYPGLPEVEITVHVSHEQWDGITDSDVVTPAVNRLEMGEHTGTHVDAINHMARQYRGQSIDTMPLTMFYMEGICLDLSYKGLRELIEVGDLERALSAAGLEIKRGDTILTGVIGVSNKEVHHVCGELGFTHYENMVNLHLLIGRGRFRFIGLPLKIRGGTGSPVRAVAVFEGART
ncbi:MAG TPA: cyclase family protein [Thermoanaerobaculia bacterium]